MIIRKATPEDWSAVLALIREHPLELMQDHLPDATQFFIAVESEEVVGCCALEVYSKRLAEVRSLTVRKNVRGKGIASALVEACVEEARKAGVYEVLSITGSPTFFEKLGFGTFNNEKYALLKIL